jgi:hypothetical protein
MGLNPADQNGLRFVNDPCKNRHSQTITDTLCEIARADHFTFDEETMPLDSPYAAAADKYRPKRTSVLFVAEAPPDAVDRYFYFEKVAQGDWLWIALMKALYPLEWSQTKAERQRKEWWLRRFQNDQFRLIDAVKAPLSGNHGQRVKHIWSDARELVEEISQIAPHQIVLIKATVHEALFPQLIAAGLPVVNGRCLPFPASGWQTEFHDELRRLIDSGALRLQPA